MPHNFDHWTNENIVRLVRENPLAWVAPRDAAAFPALLPMLIECDADGAPVSLLGHMPKRHALVGAFKSDGAARFLFLGPHRYISPEHVSNKDWAPTWNYASAQIDGVVGIDDALTKGALEKLVDHMEKDRAQPWTTAFLGERYESLRRQVVGFRVKIERIRGRFKLGQDENDTVFDEIVKGLGNKEIAHWMRQFRSGR